MATNLDLSIQFAVAYGVAEAGGLLAHENLGIEPSALSGTKARQKSKPPQWSAEEDAFLKENMANMTDAELAQALGRSEIAVHLRWERDLRLPARSKVPGILTAHQAAEMLGIDGHKTAHWVDMGLIPGRNMPGERVMRLIEEQALIRWAVNPKNWVYFDIQQVRDAHLKRLLELRAERWGDKWWTTAQVAEYHGADVHDVMRAIRLGRLRATQPQVCLSGRHKKRKWGYWYVLRSEATKEGLYFPKHGKKNPYIQRFTPAGDVWILKARDELGMTFTAIGRTMKVGKWSYGQRSNPVIRYRYHTLKQQQLEEGMQ